MERRTRQLLVFFGILLISMGACTMYYKTSDMRKSFDRADREMGKAIGKATEDYQEKAGIYRLIVDHIPDSTISPYPALASTLNELEQHITRLQTKHDELTVLIDEFENIVEDKKRIESGTPEWKEFQTVRNSYSSLQKTINSQLDQYTATSNNYVKTLNLNNITKVNIANLTSNINNYLKGLDTTVEDINKKIAGLRKRTENSADKQDRLVAMESIVANIMEKRNSIAGLVEEFRTEAGDSAEIWSGPGMTSHTIMSDIERIGKEISDLGDKFNDIAR